MDIDELDRAIISVFHDDPHATNRAVAGAVGVAEATVANRVKQLVSNNVLRFSLQRDTRALGYHCQAIIYVYARGRATSAIADDIAKLPAARTVVILQGAPEIYVFANLRSDSEVPRFLSDELGRVRGIDRVAVDLVVDVRKFDTKFAMIRPDAELA
jgi:DNA-binding Lrp family transcriptional regulator